MRGLTLRAMCDADVDAVATLYRHFVDHGVSTWAAPGEFAAPAALRERWAAGSARGLPWFVVVADDATPAPTYAVPPSVHAPAAVGEPYTPQAPLPDGAVIGPTRLVGYCYVSDFRPRWGWRTTVEDSIYVVPGWERRGVGSALLGRVVAECVSLAAGGGGVWSIAAVISTERTHADTGAASVALHARHGFRTVGVMESAGGKFGRVMDCTILTRDVRPAGGGGEAAGVGGASMAGGVSAPVST